MESSVSRGRRTSSKTLKIPIPFFIRDRSYHERVHIKF